MNIIYNGRYGYAQRSDEALRVGNRRRTRPGGRKLEEILQCLSRTNKNKLRKGREKNSKICGHRKDPRTMAQSEQQSRCRKGQLLYSTMFSFKLCLLSLLCVVLWPWCLFSSSSGLCWWFGLFCVFYFILTFYPIVLILVCQWWVWLFPIFY